MLEPLRNFKRYVRALLVTRSRAWARRVVRLGLDPAALAPADEAGRVFHRVLGLKLRADEGECLLVMLDVASQLVARGVRFEMDERCGIAATTSMFRTFVRTVEEVQILDEVVRAGAYNLGVGGDLLILDIGMNVGMASLFFAATNPKAVVYGFEPFEKTRARAQENLALNPDLAARIRMVPFGLSDADRAVSVDYSEQWRGSVGVNGVPQRLRSTDTQTQVMHLRDAAAVLEQLVLENPNRRVVMKIDCEGSEYEIVQRLSARDQLGKVDAVAMECHRRRPTDVPGDLVRILSASGFSLVHLDPQSPDISMVYAFRRGN